MDITSDLLDEEEDDAMRVRILPRKCRVVKKDDSIIEGTVVFSGIRGIILVMDEKEYFIRAQDIKERIDLTDKPDSGLNGTGGFQEDIMTFPIGVNQGEYIITSKEELDAMDENKEDVNPKEETEKKAISIEKSPEPTVLIVKPERPMEPPPLIIEEKPRIKIEKEEAVTIEPSKNNDKKDNEKLTGKNFKEILNRYRDNLRELGLPVE